MPFQNEPNIIRWRLHLGASPTQVHRLLASAAGRARFWAESAIERDDAIDFVFPNGYTWRAKILINDPPRRFSIEYIDHSITTFILEDDGHGGTDLTLTDTHVPEAYRVEVIAGWVSVLMALKAALDFNVDLRNHDPQRAWEHGFVEN
jgi:uncharacterized protein YndB with AHSA1/START domain